MYIKAQRSDKGGNKGSCTPLVSYLSKEDKERGADKEFFFSHDKDVVSSGEVIYNIDHNKGQLGKEDDKFYSIVIAPDEKELKHLGQSQDEQAKAMKEYTREVMDEYAKNFNKGLEGKDLKYYAKVEHDRQYKGTDQAVKDGEKKQGEAKEGNNLHVHVIVSRKDKENKIKLSPLTNHRNTSKGTIKGGFDRDNFKQRCEQSFDRKFTYERAQEDSYRYANTMKNGSTEDKIKLIEESVKQEHIRDMKKIQAEKAEIQEKQKIQQPKKNDIFEAYKKSLQEEKQQEPTRDRGMKM